MEHVQSSAQISVARGAGFGLLAIFCTMVGLSGTPVLALKTGGLLCLLACFILLLKAHRSARRPYRRTEVWLMLPDEQRPPPPIAQQVIGAAIRDASRRFGLYYAIASASLLALGLTL
jgi:hypothetical protein